MITPADIAAGSLEIPLEIEIRGEEPFLAFFSLTRADGVARIEAVDGRRAPPAGAWLICHPRSGSASERINAAVRLRLAPAAPPAAMSLPFRIAVRTLG